MPVNHVAQHYLRTFAAGETIDGGLAFHKALGQARLDYSPDSLQRVDMLLRQIRRQLQPAYAEFLDKQENQNFLYLLCFYVGAVVYKYTGEDFAWYPHDELRRVAPPEFMVDYPETFASSMVCMLKDSGTFLPLSSMLDILFGDDPERSVLASADKFMRRMTDATVIERPAPAPALRDDDLTQTMRAAAAQAGWAAGYGIWMTSGGERLGPTLQHQLRNGKRLAVTLVDSTVAQARERLHHGEEDAVVSVLSYEGLVGLPAFRCNAIVLEVRANVSPPVEMTIVVPYRAASDGAAYTVYGPRLLGSTTLGTMARQVIATGFFEGGDDYKPAGLLDKYLDASV